MFTCKMVSKLKVSPFHRVNSPLEAPVTRRRPSGVHCTHARTHTYARTHTHTRQHPKKEASMHIDSNLHRELEVSKVCACRHSNHFQTLCLPLRAAAVRNSSDCLMTIQELMIGPPSKLNCAAQKLGQKWAKIIQCTVAWVDMMCNI